MHKGSELAPGTDGIQKSRLKEDQETGILEAKQEVINSHVPLAEFIPAMSLKRKNKGKLEWKKCFNQLVSPVKFLKNLLNTLIVYFPGPSKDFMEVKDIEA